jgi:hypothetical protein
MQMQKRECRKQNPQRLKRNQPEKKSADFQKFLYQESAELVIIATEFFLCHVCRISGDHTGRCMDPGSSRSGCCREKQGGRVGKNLSLRKGFLT